MGGSDSRSSVSTSNQQITDSYNTTSNAVESYGITKNATNYSVLVGAGGSASGLPGIGGGGNTWLYLVAGALALGVLFTLKKR